MRLSTKSRYGLRALFDIAYNCGDKPAQIQDISRRQQISPRYLEQIFQNLKRAGILKSKRGPQGG
jgi:Rrf2 family protein